MFVGHGFIAFAIGASGAARLGVDRRRALLFGLAAGAFALAPDVDMLYAVFGLFRADPNGLWAAAAAFWDASRAVHRDVTHSLVLALPAAAGFGLAASRRGRVLAAVPLAGLVAFGWVADGALTAMLLLVFVLAGVGIAVAAARQGFDAWTVLLAALLGLVSHPFGDLFTGSPPPLFYPIGPAVLGERVTILAEPTLNLLGVFGLELAAIWVGVVVAARLVGWSLVDAVDWWAGLGGFYGAAAFVLPPPTLDTSYHFVFSVLAVGTVGVAPLAGPFDRQRVARAAVTGLTAVTVAATAYAVVFLLV